MHNKDSHQALQQEYLGLLRAVYKEDYAQKSFHIIRLKIEKLAKAVPDPDFNALISEAWEQSEGDGASKVQSFLQALAEIERNNELPNDLLKTQPYRVQELKLQPLNPLRVQQLEEQQPIPPLRVQQLEEQLLSPPQQPLSPQQQFVKFKISIETQLKMLQQKSQVPHYSDPVKELEALAKHFVLNKTSLSVQLKNNLKNWLEGGKLAELTMSETLAALSKTPNFELKILLNRGIKSINPELSTVLTANEYQLYLCLSHLLNQTPTTQPTTTTLLNLVGQFLQDKHHLSYSAKDKAFKIMSQQGGAMTVSIAQMRLLVQLCKCDVFGPETLDLTDPRVRSACLQGRQYLMLQQPSLNVAVLTKQLQHARNLATQLRSTKNKAYIASIPHEPPVPDVVIRTPEPEQKPGPQNIITALQATNEDVLRLQDVLQQRVGIKKMMQDRAEQELSATERELFDYCLLKMPPLNLIEPRQQIIDLNRKAEQVVPPSKNISEPLEEARYALYLGVGNDLDNVVRSQVDYETANYLTKKVPNYADLLAVATKLTIEQVNDSDLTLGASRQQQLNQVALGQPVVPVAKWQLMADDRETEVKVRAAGLTRARQVMSRFKFLPDIRSFFFMFWQRFIAALRTATKIFGRSSSASDVLQWSDQQMARSNAADFKQNGDSKLHLPSTVGTQKEKGASAQATSTEPRL